MMLMLKCGLFLFKKRVMIGGNNGVKINAGGLRTTRLTQNVEDN